jgi:hypothetical protein
MGLFSLENHMKIRLEITYIKTIDLEAPDGLEGESLELWAGDKADELSPCPNGVEWFSTDIYNEDGDNIGDLS